MSSGKPSIVFFGSGPVSLASLKALHANFELEMIITKPNPASSRAPRHVPDYVEQHDLPMLQPATKTELSQLVKQANFASRVGVVVDYGMIIPQEVIDSFELGIINSHFSLLPEWRGADPITFALLSGQDTTGVSLMLIVPELDEGDLLLQRPYAIKPDDNIISLTDELVKLSNTMLTEAIPAYLDDMIHPYAQDETRPTTYSRKLTKADGEIDWHKPADQIEREIRAYLGWPGSKTEINGKRVTVTQASVRDQSGAAGTFEQQGKQLIAYCGENALEIQKLKPDGKGEMPIEAFLAGNPLGN